MKSHMKDGAAELLRTTLITTMRRWFDVNHRRASGEVSITMEYDKEGAL